MRAEITIILRFDGFAIRRQKMSKPLCAWGFAIPSNRFGSFVIVGLQIPRFHRSNLFLRRISNPPGRLSEDRS